MNEFKYNPKNFEKIKAYLDNQEMLLPASQPAGTRNHVYFPVEGKGLISLNQREGTVHYSPFLDENTELKKGLLALTR